MRPLGGFLVAMLFVIARPASAQTSALSPPPDRPRFFIDVNLGGSAFSTAEARTFENFFVQSGEVGTLRATYPKPTKDHVFPLLDIGGGIMFGRRAGVGVAFSQTSYHDAATLEVTVPHPFFLQAPGIGTAPSDPLHRTENATHIFLTVTVLRTDRMEWRFSGGPSIISYSADMVSDISYTQVATADSQSNVVTITGSTTSAVHDTTVGVHAASDFAYDLTHGIALTGGVRASYGTAKIALEPLSQLHQEIRVGGWQVLVGLRFRLGTVISK